jgi:hypothetical protein
MTDIMQGRQQHIIAQRMKGMAYPIQLKVRNTMHNLYKFGASTAEERPPNIHTFPTTNHTAKKQSKAILKWSKSALILGLARTAFRAAVLRRSDTLAGVGSVELFCEEP